MANKRKSGARYKSGPYKYPARRTRSPRHVKTRYGPPACRLRRIGAVPCLHATACSRAKRLSSCPRFLPAHLARSTRRRATAHAASRHKLFVAERPPSPGAVSSKRQTLSDGRLPLSNRAGRAKVLLGAHKYLALESGAGGAASPRRLRCVASRRIAWPGTLRTRAACRRPGASGPAPLATLHECVLSFTFCEVLFTSHFCPRAAAAELCTTLATSSRER